MEFNDAANRHEELLEQLEAPLDRYLAATALKERCDEIRARALNELTQRGSSYRGLAQRLQLRQSTVRYLVEKARGWREPNGQYVPL
jgi:hypothetical protein